MESNPCFPEPHGGKCGDQADISLSGVAESHGFESADFRRFLLILILLETTRFLVFGLYPLIL